MNVARHVLWISLLGAIASGCASASLVLNLDLYGEDPSGTLVQLTPARMAELDRALKGLAREVGPLADDRVALADDLVNTYAAVVNVQLRIEAEIKAEKDPGKDPGKDAVKVSPSVVRALQYLALYRKRVEDVAQEAKAKIKEAQAALDRYAQSQTPPGEAPPDGALPAVNELSVLRAVNEAANAAARLAGPLDTDLERNLSGQWSVVDQSLGSLPITDGVAANLQKSGELPALQKQVRQLADRIRMLRGRGRTISEPALTALDQAFTDAHPGPGQLKTSFDQVIRAARAVDTAQPAPDQLEALVKASGRTFNLIDRLQDPADPMWRVVSQPENEEKWRTTFSETFFFAEGNTAVIVVRDTPFSFRVLKGTNNPTALIQSQLQISRAIANAAIAVAGAATGVPAPKLPGTGGATGAGGAAGAGGSPPVPGGAASTSAAGTGGAASAPGGAGASEAEEPARRRATVERQQAIRQEAVRSLRRNLIALRNQVERAPDQAAVDVILAQIRALLTAYDTLLAPAP